MVVNMTAALSGIAVIIVLNEILKRKTKININARRFLK
jgi:hypothetical protein